MIKRHKGDGPYGNLVDDTEGGRTPGKRTLTERLAVQLKARRAAAITEEDAAHGVSGTPHALPFADVIQRSFGRHDVSDVRAHVGGEAAQANAAMGSLAYATGNDVAFGGAPDLHTAAHEAAHVIQQRAGVHLKDGVGESGDAYERHADAVADRVVAGDSAEALLDQMAGGGSGGGTRGVQHKEQAEGTTEVRARAAEQADTIREERDAAKQDLKALTAVQTHVDSEIAEAQKKYDEAKKNAASEDPYGEYFLPEYDKLEKLKEKKAGYDAKQTELEETIDQANTDLDLIEQPGTSVAALNKLLARRGAAVAGRHTEVTVDDPEARKAAGGGSLTDRSRTTTDETSWAVGDVGATETKTDRRTLDTSGVGWGNDEQLEMEDAEGNTAKRKKSKDHKIGLEGYEGSTEETTEIENGDYSTSESKKSSIKAGASGFSKTDEKSIKVGDHEIKDESSFGVTRGDGKIGASKSSKRTEGKFDEDGNLVKGHTTAKEGEAHIIADKDGFGAGGSGSVSRETQHSKNLKSEVKAACDGHVIISIKPYEGDSKELQGQDRFVVQVSVRMAANVGGEIEASKGGKASVGGSVTVSGSIGMSFQHVMSEQECNEYVASLGALHPGDVGNGKYPEFAQIAAAWKNGWSHDGATAMANAARAAALDSPEAAREMPEGDAIEWEVEGGVEAKGKAGASYAGFEGEIEGGVTKSGKLKFNITKENGVLLITVYVEGTEGTTVGGGAGAFGIKGKGSVGTSSTSGKGATFALDPDDPNFASIKAQILGARSAEEIDGLMAKYGNLKKGTQDLISDTNSASAGLSFGDVLGVEGGMSGTVTKHTKTDAEGNEVVTDTGESTDSAKLKLGGFEYTDSETEGISTEVNADGEATGELYEVRNETSLQKTLLAWDDNRNQSGAVGVATGSTTTPKPVEETEKDVKFLANEDYDKIIDTANSPKAWNENFLFVAGYGKLGREEWAALGREIRAANGDKKKVSEALAKYMGQGDQGREELLWGVVRKEGTTEGGVVSQFPDGLNDLKEKYKALVFKDPMAEVRRLDDEVLLAEAEEEALSKLNELDSLYAALSTQQEKFSDKAAFAEMLSRIAKRKVELNAYLGKDERELAVDRFNDLADNCKRFKQDDVRLYQELGEALDANDSIQRVQIQKELEAFYLQWDRDYKEMMELAEKWGFDTQYCKRNRPDYVRLDKLRNTNITLPDSSIIEESTIDEDDRLERERAEFSESIFKRSHASIEAQAAAEGRRAEQERLAAAKAQKAQVAAAKNKAAMAAGWHNGAKKNNRPVAPEAEKLAGDGWTKFALAGKEVETLEMVASSPLGTVKGVTLAASKAIKMYEEAEALFKEGKALNVGV